MPRNYIRSLTEKTRSQKANTHLGIILTFVAGAINAGGFLAVGQYTSHMTGIASAVADYIALDKYFMALLLFMYLLSFISGAMASAIVINWARTQNYSSEYALALMLEALLLLAFGIFATNFFHSFKISLSITIALLCFIMGLQNAIITKISNAQIRTTHITGLATDIGIEIGKIIYFIRSPKTETAPFRNMLGIHVRLLISFLMGGVVGAISFKHFGFITTIPFALLLLITATVPMLDGKTHK